MKYYEFNNDITNSTEKAYAIGTGKYKTIRGIDADGRDRGFEREIIKYIPKSQCLENGNRTFVKEWFAVKNNLWNLISSEHFSIEEIKKLNDKSNKLSIGDIITIDAMEIINYQDCIMEFLNNDGLNITLKIKGFK